MKAVIQTSDAPLAIGPYSQAIRSGDLLFMSGQVGFDPKTGALVAGGVEPEAERVLENMAAVLKEAGASFDDIVKTTIFLVDLADFATVNGIYGKRFTTAPPARSTVQVAALPRGARVEIEAIVRLRAST